MANRNRNGSYLWMIVFITILLTYFGTTTIGSHIHIIDGEIIVHSHFFANGGDSSNDTNKTHSHTKKEIQVIKILSDFHSTDTVINLIELKIPQRQVSDTIVLQVASSKDSFTQSNYYLRPPPSA